MDARQAAYLAGVDPLGQGIDDQARGVPLSACPYEDGSREADAWSAGWERSAQAYQPYRSSELH